DQAKENTEVKTRFCNSCDKEVTPTKEPKRSRIRNTNIIGSIFLELIRYAYPKRCPYCGEVLRSRASRYICIVLIGLFIFLVYVIWVMI
ncbi:MAG: hypothetical protein ACW96X_12270, partial [Promethearchaeota archaeon]